MERDWLTLGWKVLALRGAIALVFGIVAVAWPVETVTVLAVLWGIWALTDGIGSIMQAFEPEHTGSKVPLILLGVVALVAAFFAIFSPQMAAATLTWVLGIWLIVRGLFELAGAFSSSRTEPRGLLVLGAGLDLVLGILFVANPGRAAVDVAWILGIIAIVWGLAFLALAFVVRKAANAAESPAPA